MAKKKPKKMTPSKAHELLTEWDWNSFKAIPFHVIFRNGSALRGFAHEGTAMANCDPGVDDHVVSGTFGWQPSKCKPKPAKSAKGCDKSAPPGFKSVRGCVKIKRKRGAK